MTMSPLIDLPLYMEESRYKEMCKFIKTMSTCSIDIEVIIPKNIYRVIVDFKYKREWKLFCEKYWGRNYFNEYIKEKKD